MHFGWSLSTEEQIDTREHSVPISQLDIPDTDISPGATATIAQNLPAWGDLVVVSTANLEAGKDAVYSDILIIFESGME